MALDKEQLAHSLTVLTRLAQREPDQLKWLVHGLAADPERLLVLGMRVAVETGRPMNQAVQKVLEDSELSAEAYRELEANLPEYTIALLPFSAILYEKLLSIAHSRDPEYLIQYAERLVEAGRGAQGQPYVHEALQRLYEGNDVHLFAEGLRVLSRCQTACGEAQAAAENAAELVRLVEAVPSEFSRAQRAQALYVMADRGHDAGHVGGPEDALNKAIELLREEEASLPTSLEDQLDIALERGTSQDGLVIFIGDPSELPEVSLAAFNDGRVRHVRRDEVIVASETSTTQVLTGLGLALTRRATLHRGAGNLNEAETDARDAAAKLRDFAEDAPDEYGPHMCMALSVLFECLADQGRDHEAADAGLDASRWLRRTITDHESGWWMRAIYLNVALARVLERLGRLTELIEVLRQLIVGAEARLPHDGGALAKDLGEVMEPFRDRAVRENLLISEWHEMIAQCYRMAVPAFPEVRPGLVRALGDLAIGLHLEGAYEEALTFAQEAVTQARQLPTDVEGRSDLAAALHSLSRRLDTLGRADEACNAEEEACHLITQIAGRSPFLTVQIVFTYLRRADSAGRPAQLPAATYGAITDAFAALHDEDDPRNLLNMAITARILILKRCYAKDSTSVIQLDRALSDLVRAHPDNEDLREARAKVSWHVTVLHVDEWRIDRAHTVWEEMGALAHAHPDDTGVGIAWAMCATELMQVHLNCGELNALLHVLRRTEHALRSPAYMKARERDGLATTKFLRWLDELIAVAEEAST